jgi:hypothetical protein
VGSGGSHTFTNPGECLLDEWMARHAFVTWTETDQPWVLEQQILSSGLVLPLNINGDARQDLRQVLSAARAAARRQADLLDVVVDSGGPRRPGKVASADMG